MCGRFCEYLNQVIPINNLSELCWFTGCHFSRDRAKGTSSIPSKTFADKLVGGFGVRGSRTFPASPSVKLENSDTAVAVPRVLWWFGAAFKSDEA